jgi:hypothetical protein
MKRIAILLAVVVLTLLVSVNAVSANTVVVAGLGPVNVPAGFGIQHCAIGTQIYVNIVQAGARVVFQVASGPCAGNTLGRTNGASDDGTATGGFVLNGVVYATGTYRGQPAAWTPLFNGGSVKLVSRLGYDFSESLYRAVQVGARVHIERNIALAGLNDLDNNIAGDGWASVGRTNGASNDGLLLDSFVLGGIPYAVIDYNSYHGGSRCILVTPGSLARVQPGQTRLMLNNGRFIDPYVGPGCPN